MGWYTSDRDSGFEYKYGDLIELARSSGLGTLALLPRIAVLDKDGEFLDVAEFLGPIQRWALGKGLDWKAPLEFIDDKHHESVAVPLDVDMQKTLRTWVGRLRKNKKVLIQAIRHFNKYPDGDVSSVTLGIEANWTLPETEYPALCTWLNGYKRPSKGARKGSASAPAAAFRLDAFPKHGEKGIPGSLKAAFSALPDKDEPRNLASHALLHAISHGTPLDLFMPDDRHQQVVWGEDQ